MWKYCICDTFLRHGRHPPRVQFKTEKIPREPKIHNSKPEKRPSQDTQEQLNERVSLPRPSHCPDLVKVPNPSASIPAHPINQVKLSSFFFIRYFHIYNNLQKNYLQKISIYKTSMSSSQLILFSILVAKCP